MSRAVRGAAYSAALLLALCLLIASAPPGPSPAYASQATVGDADGDGLVDEADIDDDNDGVADANDPAPFDASIPGAPTTSQPNPSTTDEDPYTNDADGDGIPDAVDPDDDNGGTADQDDPSPYDPGVEPTVPPDILSPDADSDGDGIPNISDPDDDADGTADHDDADPFDSAVQQPVSSGSTDDATGDSARGNSDSDSGRTGSAGVRSTRGDDAPVVTAFPVTGHPAGHDALSMPLLLFGASGIAFLVIGKVQLNRQRL